MTWQPISAMTERDFEIALHESRIVVWNECNGPHLLRCLVDGYQSAADIITEGVWDRFIVLPCQDHVSAVPSNL